ncbi:hypothetical protein [Rhizorhabdus dicambivorans]|uniref:Uncharacterized protein n=1 Tax=Rhizorhabdus dicambivorans TaxID=1850238 RepID=A0A2A4FT67_9SPHN|nr:hypothetical protein [Rhizorhabdus dicambivorans]ATE64313.1 hypothetical protein CMV14_07815 [Rhizorhabdus dicambivorans]PCE40920.1 hypothetical protein COO09_17975 [Rhizorhabdus dicambivorans]
MRLVRTAIIAGVASAALAGAAFAGHADNRMMLVALPDGSVHHVPYQPAAAPRVVLVPIAQPVSLFDVAFGPGSPFAEMERISAAMDAQADAMMRQAAAMRAQAPHGKGIVMTNAQGQPVGMMQYSFVSTSISANGCTQTVSYSSNGVNAAGEPKVVRTSAGDCGSDAVAKPHAVTPTAAPAPAARPAPKITPVSAPRPITTFTPSRT